MRTNRRLHLSALAALRRGKLPVRRPDGDPNLYSHERHTSIIEFRLIWRQIRQSRGARFSVPRRTSGRRLAMG